MAGASTIVIAHRVLLSNTFLTDNTRSVSIPSKGIKAMWCRFPLLFKESLLLEQQKLPKALGIREQWILAEDDFIGEYFIPENL